MKGLLAVAVSVAALAGCTLGGGDDSASTALRDLSSLDELRSDFEAEDGKARVLVLLAPT